MRKQLFCLLLSGAVSIGTCPQVYAESVVPVKTSAVVTAALQDGTLQLSELQDCVKNGNTNILSCTESLAKLNTVKRDSVVDTLKKADNALTEAIWHFSQSGSDTTALQNEQSEIEDQLDDNTEENYTKTYHNATLQIHAGVHQIVKASESLYFSILKLEYSMQTIQRSLDALKRTIDVATLRCSVGQASSEDLRALKDQYTDLKSQWTALQAQSKTCKENLQAIIGVAADGNLNLAVPDAVSNAEISYIDLSTDISAGIALNSTISTEQLSVDDAKDDLDDMPTSPMKQHTYQQAVYTLASAKTSFEVQATTLYQTVLENQRLYLVAATDLTAAQKTYAVSQKKYSVGIISLQDLLNAQDNLTAAQQAVSQAALSLDAAFANYKWVRLGIATA